MAAMASVLRAEERQLVLKNTFLQLQDEVEAPASARPRASSCGCVSIREEPPALVAKKPQSAELSDGETEAPTTEFPETDDESFSHEPIDMDFERAAKENVRLLREGLTKTRTTPNSSGSSSSSSSSSCGACPVPMQLLGANPFFGASLMRQPLIFVIDSRAQGINTATDASKRKQRSRASTKPEECKNGSAEDMRTTVMLRNLPRDFSRAMLLKLLDDNGFAAKYNFVYMPLDFVRQAGLGYAFINVTSPDIVQEFWHTFDGLSSWPVPCDKVCRVNWSSPHQGYEEHVQRYRNSPLMHPDVPDEVRPVLLENGVRVAFPPPTKCLRAPRLRASRQRNAFWDQEQAETGEVDESQLDAADNE